jgi:hypothetical protein
MLKIMPHCLDHKYITELAIEKLCKELRNFNDICLLLGEAVSVFIVTCSTHFHSINGQDAGFIKPNLNTFAGYPGFPRTRSGWEPRATVGELLR